MDTELLRIDGQSDDTGEMGIAHVALLTGLSRDTLRWYEREGLVPVVRRDSSGHRKYDQYTLRLLQLVVRLRRTGMPVQQVRRYVELVSLGPATHGERLDLLRQHRDAVQRHIDQLLEDRQALDHKIDSYRSLITKQDKR